MTLSRDLLFAIANLSRTLGIEPSPGDLARHLVLPAVVLSSLHMAVFRSLQSFGFDRSAGTGIRSYGPR